MPSYYYKKLEVLQLVTVRENGKQTEFKNRLFLKQYLAPLSIYVRTYVRTYGIGMSFNDPVI